jgi:AcrR family transcriptional regulator
MARTGRRRGNSDTREAILDAAREAFAERGYDGASIRAIATSAGVDPALVHHYFGTKDQLFVAATQIPIDPAQIIPAVTAGGLDGLGERIVTAFLTVWDSPAGTTAAALMRSSLRHQWSARMMRDFITTQVIRRVQRVFEGEGEPSDVELRTSLVASQMLGLAMAPDILEIQPLASAPPPMVISLVGSAIQQYLTQPLPPQPPTS